MRRDVLWISLDESVFEHLRLEQDAEGFVADGLIVRRRDEASHRICYRIEGDWLWRIRTVSVSILGAREAGIILSSDGNGRWRNQAGDALIGLDGCHDVDIQASPFTNTLAIRRVALRPAESAEIRAVFVTVPELTVRPFRQRYSRLGVAADADVYRYESLESDFQADLPIDADGLLLEYPGYFRRAGVRAGR